MTSLNNSTLPGAGPAPGPDAVFEWIAGVITVAARRLGVPPEPTGVVTEERRHHASWTWPATGRRVTLIETIPRGRQILGVRSAGATAWYEGRALRRFPGLEDMILRGLGVPSARPGRPDEPAYPPLP
jgi:hypothetical protein